MDLREVAKILWRDLNWIPFDGERDPSRVVFYSLVGGEGPYPAGRRHFVASLDLNPEGWLDIEFEEDPTARYENISDMTPEEVADVVKAEFLDYLAEIVQVEKEYRDEGGVPWNLPPTDEDRPTYLGQYFGGYYGRVPWDRRL